MAAHAIGSDGIAAALRAGVDTIEHGDGLTEPLMEEMARRGSLLGSHDRGGRLRRARPRRELDEDGGHGKELPFNWR